jgi:hypothetical protein
VSATACLRPLSDGKVARPGSPAARAVLQPAARASGGDGRTAQLGSCRCGPCQPSALSLTPAAPSAAVPARQITRNPFLLAESPPARATNTCRAANARCVHMSAPASRVRSSRRPRRIHAASDRGAAYVSRRACVRGARADAGESARAGRSRVLGFRSNSPRLLVIDSPGQPGAAPRQLRAPGRGVTAPAVDRRRRRGRSPSRRIWAGHRLGGSIAMDRILCC